MINTRIKALKLKWELWAEKKCENIDNQILKDSYYHLALRLCLDDIKQLLKPRQNINNN